MSETHAVSSPRCLACGAERSRPWAEARDLEYLTSTDAFQYLRCEACGVLFIDPCPVDRLGEIYPSNYYAYASTQPTLAHRAQDWKAYTVNLRSMTAFGGTVRIE